jgi:hypothetical protein
MKRFAVILMVTLTTLALTGCVQDKPAPQLGSPERIEAGRQAAPEEFQPAQPPPAPRHLHVLAAQAVTPQAMPSLASAATQLLAVKRFQDASARGDAQEEQTPAITPCSP